MAWLQAHPRPGIYLRQVDIPGVHGKFIESRRGVLGELLDLALPAGAIDESSKGMAGFAARYGFRDKPLRVRFRMLDAAHRLLGTAGEQDMTLDGDSFARLTPAASRVFITENEINYLAFPAVAGSMILFGAGYGFDMLAEAEWLRHRQLVYWGDIDTHGYAILDQLRARLPHVTSLLMDSATQLAHRGQWSTESKPLTRDLRATMRRPVRSAGPTCWYASIWRTRPSPGNSAPWRRKAASAGAAVAPSSKWCASTAMANMAARQYVHGWRSMPRCSAFPTIPGLPAPGRF